MITMKQMGLVLSLTYASVSAGAAQIDVQLGDGFNATDPSAKVYVSYDISYTTPGDHTLSHNSSMMDPLPITQFNNWKDLFNQDINTYQLQNTSRNSSTLVLGYYDAQGAKVFPQNCDKILLQNTNHITFSTSGCSNTP